MTAWGHLPNAEHIDFVLAQAPELIAQGTARGVVWRASQGFAWLATQSAARDAARDAAWLAALSAARDSAWFAAQSAARDAAQSVTLDFGLDDALNTAQSLGWDAARGAVQGAVLALVACDNCAPWMHAPPELVRAHVNLSEDFAARLIYPFVALRAALEAESFPAA